MNKELFILGKNVKDIGKGWNKGWNDKDNKNIFSRLTGAVKGMTAPVKISNPLIESDKKAMIEYNKVLSQTSYTQLELDSTLKSSTETAKMYAQSFNGAAVDVDGYTGTVKSATFASKALAAASVALNMAIAAAAGFAISKIIEYSQAQKQAAEDLRKSADENSKASQEEIKGLNDLIKEYKTLASQTSLTEDNKGRLLEIQNKLIDTFGLEAEGIDLVNKKYDEQIDKIEKLKGDALEEAVQTAQADYNVKSSDTSYNEKQKFYSPLRTRGDTIYNGKNKDEDYQFLRKNMEEVRLTDSKGNLNEIQHRIGSTLADIGSGKIAKVPGKHTVEDLITDLNTAINILEEGGQKSGDLYTGLINYRKEQQEVLDLYNDSKSVLAQTTFDLYTLNNPIENVTTETYKDWHDKLLLLAEQDEALKKDLIELSVKLFPDKDYQFELMTPKQREDAYKQSKLDGTYDESTKVNKVLAEAVKTVTEELEDESISLKRVNQLLQLKNLKDEEQNSLLGKQAELLESTESQISSLNGAIETLANGNKLSADEIYDLIQLYPELATNVKSLGDGYIIENDALKLVRDAHIDTALSTREAQLQTTFNVLEETANRIGLYEDEITAIESVADAQNLLAKINEDNAKRRPSSINSMADYEAFKSQGSPSNEVKNQLEDYISQREALELLQNELYGKLGTSGDGSGSGSGSGNGSDPYLKAFEDSKKELDHLRKMDVYDDWQYYLELEKLSDSYFKGKMDYLDEYYQYSSEVYTSLKDLYKKTLEEEKSKLQEVNAEEERKLSLKKAYDNYIKAQNDKMKVYYEDRGFVDEANKNDVETARLELQKQLTAQKVSEIDNKIKNLDDVPNNYYTNPKTGSNVPPSFLKPLTQADLDNLISASPALNTITKNFDLTGALFNPDAMNQVQNVTNTDNKRVVVNLSIDKIITENPEDFANQMSDIVSNKFLEILDGTLLQSENR